MSLTNFYPLLTLLSIAVFGFLGFRLARARNRNGWIWAVLGAILPPLVLIVFFLKPVAAEEPSEG